MEARRPTPRVYRTRSRVVVTWQERAWVRIKRIAHQMTLK